LALQNGAKRTSVGRVVTSAKAERQHIVASLLGSVKQNDGWQRERILLLAFETSSQQVGRGDGSPGTFLA